MASVRQTSDGNRIEVRLWHRGREYSTTTEFTKTALTRTRRIANKLQARLSHGEPWESLACALPILQDKIDYMISPYNTELLNQKFIQYSEGIKFIVDNRFIQFLIYRF